MKTARLETELTQTRLRTLMVRLNPEFIFRSFAEIASAMEKDLNQATQLIVSLGDYLRSRLKQKDVIKNEEAKGQQREWNATSPDDSVSRKLLQERSTSPLGTLGSHWKWLAVAWILTGVFFTARMGMFRLSQGNLLTFENVILMNVPWFLWAFATPSLLRFYARFPLESKYFLRNFGIHLLIGMGFWVSSFILGFFSQSAINRFAGRESSDLLLEMINMGIAKHLLAYWLFLFFVRANRYYSRYVQRKLALSELELQLTSAQLQALKMQLHPHFLFNALHSLMGLIQEDLASARRMLFQLQHFFKLTLQDMTEQKVPLKKELEFLNCYLDIEKVRYQDRLNVTLDVDPGAMKVEVPNLILQPLVENAVKHGVSHRNDCGEIHI
ncbi:MAG: histidine kinase, partial [Acidobacteriota bacterium]